MSREYQRLILEQLQKSKPNLIKRIQETTGINWNSAPLELKLGSLDAYINHLNDQERREEAEELIDKIYRQQESLQEKEHKHQIELQDRALKFMEELEKKRLQAIAILEEKKLQAYTKIEEVKLYKLDEMFKRLSEYIVKGVTESLRELPKQFVEEGAGFIERLKEKKPLPESQQPATTIIRVGDPSHCIAGPEGPNNVVYSIHRTDGVYQKCIIADAAHKRSVLGIQMINSPRLKEGGCPLYYSRNLFYQFAGDIVPLLKHEKCDLADGREHYFTK